MSGELVVKALLENSAGVGALEQSRGDGAFDHVAGDDDEAHPLLGEGRRADAAR